jgi:hypothetical protein
MKPPYRIDRFVLWVFALPVAVVIGFIVSAVVSLPFLSSEACPGPDPDPLLPCFPAFKDAPIANVVTYGVGAMALLLVLLLTAWADRRFMRDPSELPRPS